MSNEPNEPSQLNKFKEAARDLGTDDDPQRFKERLAKLVKQASGEARIVARIKSKPLNALEAALVVPPAIILLLITTPIGWLTSRPKKRSASNVVGILTKAASGTISQKEWRRFTRKRISDLKLDAIRERAIVVGPPHADRLMLRQLIAEANSTHMPTARPE